MRIRGHWYYARTLEGKQYGLSCRRPVTDPDEWTPPRLEAGEPPAEEEVLIDANALAEGHDFFSLGASSVSPDGRLLAFSTDTTGDERFLLQVKDIGTGELLPDQVPDTSYGVTWDLTGTHLFYTTVDEAWRPHKIWRHRLGTDPAEDVVVHHETDERFWVSVGRTRSDRFLVIGCGSKVTSEYHVLDADDPTGEFRVVAPRRQGVEYGVEHAVIAGQDVFLVLHNDGAENFEVATPPSTATSHEQWQPLLPHDPAVRLEDVDAFADPPRGEPAQRRAHPAPGAAARRGRASPRTRCWRWSTPSTPSAWPATPSSHQPTLRFGYTTMATPSAVHQLDLRTGERTLLKETPVLGDFDPTAYEQHREWAIADDGTQVPISIVVPRGTPRDGSAPFVLYGYGAYETSIDPCFTISRLSLLDRGMGFAIAHVRGGGELGRRWYDEGKLLAQAQHVHRLRRLRRAPGRHRLDAGGPPRRRGRQRRRAADGRGREPRARGVRRHRRRRAVRRRADHDPGPEPAAHGRGVGGVGQPAARTPRSTPT